VLAAVALTSRIWADPAMRLPTDGSQVQPDVYLNIWFMRYAATAVQHGQLPALMTSALNAPHGINLMWNTSLLLPGVLLAPVTLLAGPTVSLAVLLTAGFAGSASSMYLVARRWKASVGAAVVGGAVYGFSPALLVAAQDHYHLQFAVLPPLIVDAVLRLATGRCRPLRTGALLGLLVAAQVFIAEEILVDTALVCGMAVVVLVASRPSAAAARLKRAVAGLGVAAGVTLLTCGDALWVQFLGPLTEHGSPWRVAGYKIRPADFVTAPNTLLLHGHFGGFLRMTGQTPPETFAYLGWPLLVTVAVATIVLWRDIRVRVAGLTFAMLAWLGLGGQHVRLLGWRVPAVLLPWHWLAQLSVMNQVLPNRFPILADGAAAAVLAFAIDRGRAALPLRQAWRGPVAVAAALLILVPVIPRLVPAASPVAVPPGLRAVVVDLGLSPGATVLVLPIDPALAGRATAMEWQAISGVPISLVGGYCITPAANGRAVSCDGIHTMTHAQHIALVRTYELASGGRRRARLPAGTMAAAISAWRPAAVITPAGRNSTLGRYLIRFFGPPTVQRGTLLGWRVLAPGRRTAARIAWALRRQARRAGRQPRSSENSAGVRG
jgi:hypothetical protein